MAIKAVIRGSAGTAMVDGTWRNMSLDRKIIFTAAGLGRQAISRNLPYEIWCYSIEGDNTGLVFTSSSQSVGDNNSYNTKNYYYVSHPTTIYVFADKEIVRAPFGLNIKNELGVLVFSSSAKPLRVIAHRSGIIPEAQRESDVVLYSAWLSSGRKYAVMLGDQPCRLNVRSDGTSIRTLLLTTRSDGFTEVKYSIHVNPDYTGEKRGTTDISFAYSFQIIDVTGY